VRRADLEHLLRACAAITGEDEFIVVGSQAILGEHPIAPPSLLVSVEADIYPRRRPDLADLIDGSIGEGSPFHETFGYYAQGVGPETASCPVGWESRLIRVETPQTRGAIGYCLETHDLVVSKVVAGREKDVRFLRESVAAHLVNPDVLRERIGSMALDDAVLELGLARINASAAGK